MRPVDIKANFSGGMPAHYDRYLGPAWFDAFGRDLASRLPPKPPGDVLELACGTGLVTSHLRDRLNSSVRLVATDISKSMVDYAREKTNGRGGIEFREADAMKLPFADGEFGAVVCAFGLMYFPDKAAGLREIRRVLGPRGLLVFNVFDRKEENPASKACGAVFEELFPDDSDARFDTPYMLADTALLWRLVEAARFDSIVIETRKVAIQGIRARDLATGQIRGSPRVALVEQRGMSADRVIERVAEKLTAVGGDPFQGTAQCLVVEAKATP
jgi:SAM-dependent methyltransferase